MAAAEAARKAEEQARLADPNWRSAEVAPGDQDPNDPGRPAAPGGQGFFSELENRFQEILDDSAIDPNAKKPAGRPQEQAGENPAETQREQADDKLESPSEKSEKDGDK